MPLGRITEFACVVLEMSCHLAYCKAYLSPGTMYGRAEGEGGRRLVETHFGQSPGLFHTSQITPRKEHSLPIPRTLTVEAESRSSRWWWWGRLEEGSVRGGKERLFMLYLFYLLNFVLWTCIILLKKKKKCCFKDSIKAKKRNLRFCFLVGIASWVYFISYPVFYLICDFLEWGFSYRGLFLQTVTLTQLN